MAYQYGQIINDGNATQTKNHNLGTSNYCVFLTQDITDGGGSTPFPRAFVSAKGPTSFDVTDNGGSERWSALAVAAHSLVDVGPIVNGPTRNLATEVTKYRDGKGLPSYRSLHNGVFIPLVNGTASSTQVITHHLHTLDVMVFVSPKFDPFEAGLPGNLIVCWHDEGAKTLDTITLKVTLDDGVTEFAEDHDALYDVMVVGWPNIGHSVLYHGGGAYAGGPPSLARLPSYHVGYYNATINEVAPEDVVHNLNGDAGTVLIGYANAPGNGCQGFVMKRDQVANTTARLYTTDVTITDLDLLVVRGHSRPMGP